MADHRPVVVIPTYNEAENVARIIPEIHAAVPSMSVLVVDDGSPDGTGRIVEGIAAGDERVRLLSRAGKQGLGTAYVAGFKDCLARGHDLICQMDCDFSHQPRYLVDFLREIETADVVIGSRYMKGGMTENWPLRRKVLSKGGNLYARTILGLSVTDLTGGFKCWRREVLEGIDLYTVQAGGYAFQMEMNFRASRLGFRIKEIPIVFPERVAGESKLGRGIFWESLGMPWRLRFGAPRRR
ncbi:MAG: polyprenol monophosphomannose synthase [Deltaproteobacteria bacterium]|nr:polyprenol monophosphomannose synthase [Deltaproteobacteria bacterium]